MSYVAHVLFLLFVFPTSDVDLRNARTPNQAQPHITSVAPDPVVGSTAKQWLTINGDGFAPDFTIQFRAEGVDAAITNRQRLDFVSTETVRVQATFGTERGTWAVQLINPDGAVSESHRFMVAPPVPQIEVLRPTEQVESSRSFVLTVYGSTVTDSSVIRWDGADCPTTPIKTSSEPDAMTVGSQAKIPAGVAVRPGRHEVRVYTPPPGGGLSAPTTVLVNPLPLYRTPRVWLLFMAGLALGGYGLYRWRLKNLRERYSREVIMQPEGVSITPEQEAFFEEARAVVEEHLGELGFTVEQFASEMTVSRSTLRRKLKAATEMTPGQFIREMRLRRAAQLLEADFERRSYEVANAVGYRSADHFARIFRERFGASPSAYEGEAENI